MEHHQTKYETMDQEKSQTTGNIKLSLNEYYDNLEILFHFVARIKQAIKI